MGWLRFSLFFFANQVRPEQVRFVDPNGALISVEDVVLDDEGRFYFPIVTLKVVVDPDLTHEYNALTRQLSLNLNGTKKNKKRRKKKKKKKKKKKTPQKKKKKKKKKKK